MFNRPPIIRLESENFKFVKKENAPDLAFSRVGFKAGEISVSNIELKSKNTHYFIKLKDGFGVNKFIEAFKKIKFMHNNTVAQKSISQQELLFELKKHGI